MISHIAAQKRAAPDAPQIARTSDLLRGVLTRNPDTQVFTIERIMQSLGEDRFDANILFMSLPTLRPVPDKLQMTDLSAALMAGQMAAGRSKPVLPRPLLEREIPRRSLAIAIHLALPVIEAAEKVAKPRLKWLSHPLSRRILGAFLFVLAATVAFPLIGFDPLQSLSTFAISLGLAEGDGVAILLGVAIGVLSLAVIVASNFSARSLRAKAAAWLKRIARKLGASALVSFSESRGFTWIAKILNFEWSQLLLLWNPERAPSRPAPHAADATRPTPAPRPKPKRASKRIAPPRRPQSELVAVG